MLNSSKVCFLEDNIDSLYCNVEGLNGIIRPGRRVSIIKGSYGSKSSPHLRRASWWKRRKLKILVLDFINCTLSLLVRPHLLDPGFSTYRPHSRLFKGVNNRMVLHSLLINHRQIAEERSNCILKIKALNRILNCQLIVMLPGAKDANI
jgi:hypothetical protein